ncbi:MAG: GNAT family N-acetyltransferase [Sarcina sp.]
MEGIRIVKVKEEYIDSYWYAFDSIAREKKYFASTNAYPYDDTYEFMKEAIKMDFPSFFAIQDDKVIGFADARPMCCKIGYVGIGIIKGFRDKGLGRELMKKIIDESKMYGYKSLEIDVRKDNIPAIKLYEKLGFKKRRELKNALILDEKKITVLQMEKII